MKVLSAAPAPDFVQPTCVGRAPAVPRLFSMTGRREGSREREGVDNSNFKHILFTMDTIFLLDIFFNQKLQDVD